MKLHLPCLLRRAVVRALFAAATVVTTLASSTYADMITPDGRTATQVIQSGNVYDVYTNTVRGNTGFNSFSTFDVYAETTANLHLADGTGRLINVVRDSASHIDGVLNSYRDGRIGGDVYFLNPNGIIVGKSGVINVGSISMSTPTAAFVEQLIARDGSISATATQAVLAGDMPINEKGTISIKGKVNARGTAELRAGKVEVKGGEINTDVRFHEMVNSGGRKVGAKGMSIQDGRLSFGKKPAKAHRVAKAKERKPERKADIAIFADDVLVDGGNLNADWVYIDPDKLEFSNLAISGDYTLEARVIVLNNVSVKEGETLTTFTLNAANELADGTFEGNVSITLSNSNIVADEVNISASATTNAAEAIVSITGSTLSATQGNGSLTIYAISTSGNSRVDIQGSTIAGAGGVEAAAMSVQGNAALTLDAASTATSDVVALAAAAGTGNADVSVQGKVAGGNDVTIIAATGGAVSDYAEGQNVSEMEFTPEGGGNATVTVGGTVEAKGALTVGAYALGTYGDATVNINGNISSIATETKQIGELGLDRTEAETVNETDTEETANAKNAAYLDRYVAYLKTMPTAEGATGTIAIDASSTSGNASISQAAGTQLTSSLSASISADAARAASVTLAGRTTSGNITGTAKGETSTLRTVRGSILMVGPHQRFVQDGTVVSMEKANGSITLEAGTRDGDNPDAPLPEKRDGVLLEVAGAMSAQRGKADEAGEGGAIALVSAGKLTVGTSAAAVAISANGKGGLIYLDAPEYEILADAGRFRVDGSTESGRILLMNHEELTGDNINNVDEISGNFLRNTFNPTFKNNGGGLKLLAANNSTDGYKDWDVGYVRVRLSGNIKLNQDVNASISASAIEAGTHIDGQGQYSLTLTNSYSHRWDTGCTVLIGDGVSITGVKNFTLDWNYASVMESVANTYFGAPTKLEVGKDFTVQATGDVAITLAGMYDTSISFREGVDIQAGGKVTISAKTVNGMGSNLFTGAAMDPISWICKQIPSAQDSSIAGFFSQLGIIKINTDKCFAWAMEGMFGKTTGKNSRTALSMQLGARASYASVTFDDNSKSTRKTGIITGANVTISSFSAAIVAGRKIAANDLFGLSLGFIYNNSKVDLGKNLTITATGMEDESGKVSISSSTKSKVGLQYIYKSQAEKFAVGALISTGIDFNTLTIDESVTVKANNDIDVSTNSSVEAKPFMTLGRNVNKQVDLSAPKPDNPPNGEDDANNLVNGEDDEPVINQGTKASNIVMAGVNVVVHESKATVNGTFESANKSVSIQSKDEISSSLTMSGGIQYTLSKKPEEKGDNETTVSFLKKFFRECVIIDPFIGQVGYDKDADSWKLDTANAFEQLYSADSQAKKTYNQLIEWQKQSAQDVKEWCVDISVAADVVVSKNTLIFNGKASAKHEEGSVTLSATSSIEAACGAETSIVGVPVKNAVAGSIAVPVVDASTTVQIGGAAEIAAGKDINVSSSTDLPMSLDYMGWNGWKDFARAEGAKKAPKFVSALRGMFGFFRDYRDNGEFGVLDALTSSHASTLVKDTGNPNDPKEATIVGGDFVVDVRNLDTKTIISDGAKLTAGANLKVGSTTTGKQATVAGRFPAYLSTSLIPSMTSPQAGSGFGFSTIVGKKTLNTVTYIGAATLEADQLNVDATGDVFMIELSAAGTIGASDKAFQGSVSVIYENKMTVSEISGGARITLHGKKDSTNALKSSVTAADKSTLLNITGLVADTTGSLAIGAGAGVTVNNAFTAAMLGNGSDIPASYKDTWESIVGDYSFRTFARETPITLNFTGNGNLAVEAEDKSVLVTVGVSGAIQRGKDGGQGAGVAANVGVLIHGSETTARQNKVYAVSQAGGNDITTKAGENAYLVSVAGDASINISKGKDYVNGAGAVSVITGKMDTTAYVTDFIYTQKDGREQDITLGKFTVDSSNTATAVAVDVAAGIGAAAAGIAAGVSVNVLSGNTGSYLMGGSVYAKDVDVTSLTNLTSCSITLGAAFDISINADGGSDDMDKINGGDLKKLIENSDVEEKIVKKVGNNGDNNNIVNDENNGGEPNGLLQMPSGGQVDVGGFGANLANGAGSPVLLGAGKGSPSFDLGASIAVNKLDMRSSAIVEGCAITTPGELKVTAEDKSVITSISVGAAVTNADGTAIAAGGVFAFAPVGSITEAVIRQSTYTQGKLEIKAGSLTLHATDSHRERVWSIGGGYGSSAGIGVVLTWGSFAGATTMALIENVNAEIADKADILASSTLDATYISVGGSGSTGVANFTGMVNYINFNNHVVTDIKGSTLTIANTAKGVFSAKSQSKRTFTDGAGALDLRLGMGDRGGSVGAALSFVYVGGNGADDTNLTQTLVSNSVINNAHQTDLLADSHTDGLMAIANAGVDVSFEGGGIAANGSVGLLNDSSLTQVDIVDTDFNKLKPGGENNPYEKAVITAKADSGSQLTLGLGTLGVEIGEGAGFGASVGLLKDQAVTMATMTGGSVCSAQDFSLLANGKADLAGLVIGGGGSGTIGVAGAAMSGTIAHTVVAKLAESIVDIKGALTVKAENTSNVGRDKGPRFTVVNGAVGLLGGGVGADVSIIDVADLVQANAHNVSVHSASMDVLANEHSSADAVTASVAGGQYAGVEVNVVLPVLRGAAEASITADKEKIGYGDKVGVTTTGNLAVAATNNQWMRSHLWTLALVVNPTLEPDGPSLAGAVCVNSINLAGSSDARIQGPLTLNVGGNLAITADTDRYATYTTVPVAAAVAIFSAALNVDVNSMRVSGDTSPMTADQDTVSKQGITAIDNELAAVKTLINNAGVKVYKDAQLTISSDVGQAMQHAVNAVSKITDPKTIAVLDLAKGNGDAGTAAVGGSVTILAKDKVTSTPTTVNVTGGALAIATHITNSTVESTVEAIVKDTVLTATGDISIKAMQEHSDNFVNDAVALGLGGSVNVAVYRWNDHPNEKVYLRGKTKLISTGGSVTVATDSHIHEAFKHVEGALGLFGAVACYFPSFEQVELNELGIDSNVYIQADKAVNIGTNSYCNFEAYTVDETLAAVVIEGGNTGVNLTTTQNLTTGDGVTIEGSSVAISQNAKRHIDWVTTHVVAAVGSLSFPYMAIRDTVNAAMTIGDWNQITATAGTLTIDSAVDADANIRFYGVNAGVANFGAAWNSFKETITNKAQLGNNVKLRAREMTVRAKSTHTGDLKGNNIMGNLVGGDDVLNTYNDADVTSTVTIGTGFDAAGSSLTLEALNTDNFFCRAEKVTISLGMAPYSRNAFHSVGSSIATVTLGGGKIDVQDFNAKATTDVTVKVQQRLAGGSLIENTNTGNANNTITQTSAVTLGTDSNELDILTDNVGIIAHNKYLFDRLDAVANTMVYGENFGFFSVTDAHVEAEQKETATVTLGEKSKIRRREDVEHYLKRNTYKTLISATNNVESNASLDLLGCGLFSVISLFTRDETTASATLNLNGGIDTWGNTELTAYSHARHNMRNTVEAGGIPCATGYNNYPVNKIAATDTVNINGTVESIGDITIQAGSTKGDYTLVDGATVLAGDDDTNSTSYNYGKAYAQIENKRTEKVGIGAGAQVRAGGELAIYNDSSANTSKKPFAQKYTADDYARAAIDTAAEVTSTVEMGAGAKLYAGLGSAVKMIFHQGGSVNEATLQFITAQRIFGGSTEQADGTWLATGDAVQRLYSVYLANNKGNLAINGLTLPGMAFRIVSKAENLERFKGKLYSPAEHGLDLFIAADWNGNVETRGVTLQGHETGLVFNRAAVDPAKFTVANCAGPDLYLPEGVAIRSQADGGLTMTGSYQFPYSTFLATSDSDLTITGDVHCGNTVFQAGGNFSVDTPQSDYALRGALSMYEALFKEWEATIPGKVKDHAEAVVSNSGAGETHDNTGVYKAQNGTGTYDKDKQIIPAVTKAIGDKEASINAMGTVTIIAKVVDLNGKISSGLLNSEIVINPDFKVLTGDGKSISRQAADDLYNQDHSSNIFKLEGYTGISLVYDARAKEISLNSFESRSSGISITGNIVNSNPIENAAALYVAGPDSPLTITNKSGLTLNIGNVDLMKNAGTSGITLNNTETGVRTKYELKDGQWFQTVGDKAPTVVGSTATYDTDSGMSKMQVKLERKSSMGITENGRLTFGGSIGDVDKTYEEYKFHDNGTAGLIGAKGKEKQTIVDAITVNTNGVQYSDLTASYVAYADTHQNGYACSTHSLSDKKVTRIYNAGVAYRWQYSLEYDELVTAELYVSAANDVAINLGGTGGTAGLNVTSGNVNFTGNVKAASCTVAAADSITALGGACVNSASIKMTATSGSIGGRVVDGKKVALAFTADTATFTAGGDIYLSHVSDGEIGMLDLNAGKSLELRSNGTIKDLRLTALDSATVEAAEGITVTGGRIGGTANMYPATLTLSSQNGGVTVNGGDFTHGILTVEARDNVSIVSTPAGNLTLDFVESREGNVSITANGGILSVRGADMSQASFKQQSDDMLRNMAEEAYGVLTVYERRYYEKDKDGNYLHRTADGILVLPEEDEKSALDALKLAFTDLYNTGRGDELGEVMLSLSGTAAVGGTVFKDTAEALVYLAKHSDKLEPVFVRAYYDKVMADITNEIRLIHGPEDRHIDYGTFNESIYRLYWLRDCTGRLVNQDAGGNFISPVRDGTEEAVYSPETCAAITRQFREQPAFGGQSVYNATQSPFIKELAQFSERRAIRQTKKMEDGLASFIGGQALGDVQATISANRGQGTVTLNAGNGAGDIGGGTFRFTISPIKTENNVPVYSEWAQAFIDSATTEIWPGLEGMTKNEKGDYQVSLAYVEIALNGVDKLNEALLQHALPMDVQWKPGFDLYRVSLRNYVGVDAMNIEAQGKSVLLASHRDITLGGQAIQADNLFLSTSGSLSGSVENTRGGGFVSLYADKGIGSADSSFRIGGKASFTLGSLGDVYVKSTGAVNVRSITGKYLHIDATSGDLTPVAVEEGAHQPNIIGQRIDYHGNLDTGLNFRTLGTSREEGGLHWYGGGSSGNLKFNALNNAYTFWFVREDGAPEPDRADIGYSGHLYIVNLAGAGEHPLRRVNAKSGAAPAFAAPPAMGGGSADIAASFHQINKGSGINILEFDGNLAFDSLSLDGEGTYTVMSSGEVLLGSALSVGGSATLSFAGLGSAQGEAVNINSSGDLALASCGVVSDLVVNGTGNVSLADVHLAGEASIAGDTVSLNSTSGSERLVLSGSNGVSATDVSSAQIVANSSNAGVFLNSTSTNSLSGSSHKSFVASVQALDGTAGVTVGNVSADGATSKVIIQAIADQLVLDGLISGAALEFYSTGAIDEETGAMLLSSYPFWDVWQSGDPEVWQLAIETLESDLREGYIWLVEEVESLAEKSSDSADELRRKVNAEGQPHSAAPLRFTDKDGNTVSRSQFAKLITSK